VIGKKTCFTSFLKFDNLFLLRDVPDQPPSHFDPPGGSSYFHGGGGGGGFHPNFPPNVHQSGGAAATDQFNK